MLFELENTMEMLFSAKLWRIFPIPFRYPANSRLKNKFKCNPWQFHVWNDFCIELTSWQLDSVLFAENE